jgi:hypothetical protein
MEKIATEIATGNISNIYPALLFIAITIVASALGSYLGSYLKKRGETYATKIDLQNIVNQIKKTTEATEEIKTKIAHNDWIEREEKSTKKKKLEELFSAIYESNLWLMEELVHARDTSKLLPSTTPIWKVRLIGGLYFPEHKSILDKITSKFLMTCGAITTHRHQFTMHGHSKENAQKFIEIENELLNEFMALILEFEKIIFNPTAPIS